MVSEKLLNEKLEYYKELGLYFSPIKYTKDLPKYLLENFSNCGMTENCYCCNKGLDSICWQEITEEGI